MSFPAAHKRLHAPVACLFYDQRYKGRFHTLKTIDALMNEISPWGKVINRFTSRNAFSINGRGDYAEYDIPNSLCDVLICPEGTILAVCRVKWSDPTQGFLTAVGCFQRGEVPGEDVARKLDRDQNTASPCGIADLPRRVRTDLNTYATQTGKHYFATRDQRRCSTHTNEATKSTSRPAS